MSKCDYSLHAILKRVKRKQAHQQESLTAEQEKMDTESLDTQRPGFTSKPQAQVKVSDLTRSLVLADTGVSNEDNVKLQNFGGTNFPKNTPCYINGPKGSGKTYLLASLLQYIFKLKLCRRVFYIYAENVDTTIARAVPKDHLYQIPKNVALGLMVKYLAKKTRVCCCSRFVMSYIYKESQNKTRTLDELMKTSVYWDNMLDELSKRKHFTKASELFNYCSETVKKYAKGGRHDKLNGGVIIRIGDLSFNVGDITANDFDMFVIDDIAQFYDLFGNTRATPFYKYFTITRQNMTTFYLAGQDLGQLPKMYRDQLGALVALYGTSLDDLQKYRISKRLREEITEKFLTMIMHEGVLYNYNTNTLEVIKS